MRFQNSVKDGCPICGKEKKSSIHTDVGFAG